MQDVIIQRHSESGFLAAPREVRRKPPASEQFNWISCAYDVLPVLPEQLELDLSLRDGAILPDDRTVTLLATENCAQLLADGYGPIYREEGEGIVVRKGGGILRADSVHAGARGGHCVARGGVFRPLGGALRAWHQHGMYDFERKAGGVDHISASDDHGHTVANLAATDNECGAEFWR